MTEGGSEDGGLEELVEFLLAFSSKVAIRCSSTPTKASTAACAAGGMVSQRSCEIGGRFVITPF